ncbi:MAG: hypothetical protein U1F55_07130 [Chitinivorax sp.]
MSAAPWKCYNRLQEIAERYEKSIEDLIHLASQGQLTLYGCLPSGVYLRKGPGGESIGAKFVRLSQGDAQKLELHGKVTLSQFDTAVSVIDGVCIEHDSIGRQLDGLVNRLFNRFSTQDGKPVTFELNDIFLIHERNMKAILRHDLWRSSVFDIDAAPECADAEGVASHAMGKSDAQKGNMPQTVNVSSISAVEPDDTPVTATIEAVSGSFTDETPKPLARQRAQEMAIINEISAWVMSRWRCQSGGRISRG